VNLQPPPANVARIDHHTCHTAAPSRGCGEITMTTSSRGSQGAGGGASALDHCVAAWASGASRKRPTAPPAQDGMRLRRIRPGRVESPATPPHSENGREMSRFPGRQPAPQ